MQSWGKTKERESGRQQQSTGHLVFLSARPESYKGFTEVMSFKRIFEPLIKRGELQVSAWQRCLRTVCIWGFWKDRSIARKSLRG